MTGFLGIVCALFGMLVAPSLFLPLAIAFSAVALVRSLVIFNVVGTLIAAVACIVTVVGMVLFPLGAIRAPRMATATEVAEPAGQPKVAVTPPADVTQQPAPGLAPKATEPSADAGSLSLPPSPPAPEPQAAPAAPSQAAQPEVAPTRAPPEAIPSEAAKPRKEMPPAAAEPSAPPNTPTQQQTLQEALPEPPPQAAAVVPDPMTSTPAAEAPKPEPTPATTPTPVPVHEAAKGNALAWPENRTEQTKVIQVLLRDLDFYHGTTNGTFGPATRAAICLYLVTYDEKGECEPSKALFDSLQKRRANANVGSAPR